MLFFLLFGLIFLQTKSSILKINLKNNSLVYKNIPHKYIKTLYMCFHAVKLYVSVLLVLPNNRTRAYQLIRKVQR